MVIAESGLYVLGVDTEEVSSSGAGHDEEGGEKGEPPASEDVNREGERLTAPAGGDCICCLAHVNVEDWCRMEGSLEEKVFIETVEWSSGSEDLNEPIFSFAFLGGRRKWL